MLLTIDAGNTNIVAVIFDGDKQVLESRIDTDSARMADQYAVMFDSILRLYNADKSKIDGAVISSVVPTVTRQLSLAVKRLFGVDALIADITVKSGLDIKIDEPTSLGADLLCGAVAAKNLYKPPCIAIDMGTVTKVMAINKDGALIGGAFCPGVGIGLESMAGKTALLPVVEVGKAEKVIGTNTADGIRSGLLFGTACMLDGLTERFEAQIVEPCTVVATGGWCEAVIPYCKREIIINKSLVSEGLRIIYEINRGYL